MIKALIDLALRNRVLVVLLYLGLAGWGWWAMRATPIDAIPDLSDNQVIVFTDWAGHSPQEVEDQITYPLTTNLQGLAGVRAVRSQSAFGFSMIYVVFDDGVDLYFARTRVLERLSLVGRSLPSGIVPTLGPDATGVGHVFWYTLDSPTHDLRELRTLQDWFVRYQLNAVPGVAEVASVGGHVQQYQIDVDPNRLRAYSIPLSAVVSAVQASNLNVGGNVLESNGAWLIVRGIGLIASVDDVKRIVIGATNGVPVYVEQVADVDLADLPHVDGDAAGRRDDDVLEVGERLDEADAAHDRPRAVGFEHVSADVLVAVADRLDDAAERQVVGAQAVRIDVDLVLLDVAADRRDLGDARHRVQLIADEPVLQRPQVAQRMTIALDGVPEHVTDPRRVGPECRHRPLGHLRGDEAEALEDAAPGEVLIDLVLEDHVDHREAEGRLRADHADAGQSAEVDG